MAGFKTHISFSSTLGIGYACGAYALFDMPWTSCVIAGGLCSVSGMLPDLDSGSGRPIRESMGFAAAVIPMMCLEWFEAVAMPRELMIVSAVGLYLLIRFGLAWAITKYTVHRGMFHSVPAAVLAAMVVLLLCGGQHTRVDIRLFKAGGVFVGYVSHLLLDELWSLEWRYGLLRRKKSFGSAMKLWGKSLWGNLSVYGKLAAVAVLVGNDTTLLPPTMPSRRATHQSVTPDSPGTNPQPSGNRHRDPREPRNPLADHPPRNLR